MLSIGKLAEAFSQHLSLSTKLMPRIPTTSKKARTLFNAQPLVPPSIKAEAHKADSSSLAVTQEPARRSTRLAAAVKTEQLPSYADEGNSGKVDQLPGKVKAKSRARTKATIKAIAVNQVQAAVESDQLGHDVAASVSIPLPETKKQKRGKRSQVKVDGTLGVNSQEADLEEPKPKPEPRGRKRKAVQVVLPSEDVKVTASKAKAPARRKGSKIPPEEIKILTNGNIDKSDETEEEAVAGGKPKKRRVDKTNAGFAIRNEEIEDTPEARRARIKASVQAEKLGVVERPFELESDVERMCKELGNDRLGQTAPWQNTEGSIGGLKWWTGCHCSSSGGVDKAVINAAATGCRSFAMDVKCKVRWESPPLTEETINAFKDACQKFGYGPEQILPHGSYLINLASPNPNMAKKGYGGFLEELQRCESLGLKMYNFHPGSTTGGCTHEESMDRIAGFINDAHKATKGVTVVLENMSSVGNIVGGRMWHLRYIIDKVEDKSRIGFCIDTCHLFSSGIDLRTEADCEAAFEHIDDVIGLQYLRGLHLNDSKTPFDSHRDRHENIGRGSIPMACFKWIMNNPRFQGIPMIMETPVQEREAPVDFKKSLQHSRIWWKDPNGPYGVGTDRRDIILLNSLISKCNWD